MKLLIDIGNTRSKFVFVDDQDTLIATSDIQQLANSQLTTAYFVQHWQDASAIILASVNEQCLTEQICSWAQHQQIPVLIVQTQQEQHGVRCAYATPSNLGVDRTLALVGAHAQFPNRNLVIIDSGTATTVDVLTAQGQHLGGWIVPGIDLMYQALMANTASIHALPARPSTASFGQNSPECVNQGIWAMTLGLIKQAVDEANKLIVVDDIIICGGNGRHLYQLNEYSNAILEETLVFKGLQKYLA